MIFRHQNLDQLSRWIKEGHRFIRMGGLPGSARSCFLANLLSDLGRSAVIFLPAMKDVKRFYRELEFFMPPFMGAEGGQNRRLFDFPIYDITPLAGLRPHRDVVSRRIQSLYALAVTKNPILVASIESTLLKILPKDSLLQAVEPVEVEEEVDRDDLIRRLEVNGYERTSIVEERGEYCIRGGVIDIFPPLYSEPLRMEFWGDQVESIRHFEVISQRSTVGLREAVILPANEILMNHDNIKRARDMGRLPPEMAERGAFPGQEAWLNHFYPDLSTFFDYAPSDSLFILIDPMRMEKTAEGFAKRFVRDVEKYSQEAEDNGQPFPEISDLLIPIRHAMELLTPFQRIESSEISIQKQEEGLRILSFLGVDRIEDDLEIRASGKGTVSMAPLAEKIAAQLEMGARVVLVCRTSQQAERLGEILKNYSVEFNETVNHWVEISSGRGLTICLGQLSKGFSWPEIGIEVVSEDEIFGPKQGRIKARAGIGKGRLNWTNFSNLKEGDLVVHQDHGIGRYGGLSKIEVEEKVNDFVILEYANNDRLYIPADRISMLQKYIGADDGNPKLDQLGGRSWDVAKKKAKKSIREIAKQLVETYALREHRKGFSFSRVDTHYREFEATFEHEETPDQIKTIDEVISDMESDKPMDRLVCGDVGFGKTEIAIRAAFKAVSDGKQVAMLVPTTVLAEQHYETFKKRMGPYSIRIGVLSRFKTRKEQQKLIAETRSGKIDIVLGTHRIIQKDISFRDLGLLIIDEEQRFGVKQKEALKRFRALVDVLALTATPIPRTLHLSLMGIRDLSIIETPPEDRFAIQTHITQYDDKTIIHAIESEIERGGQVFFVHNRVHTINQMAQHLQELVPKARFSVAHGQMKAGDLEMVMLQFLRREIDVLVCTTIIESGLDIPSANTIIIHEADRFGLSQIYQLRGRVGRADEHAYAYLLLSSDADLSRDAEKRLRALMDFSHLGAGLHLAMHDLKIRGGGNILGFSQSGHISAIGYELYIKLIEQNIAELKGEPWQEEIDPEINIDMAAYLPSQYIKESDVRLNLYRRLSSLAEESELQEMIEEMVDRFGPPPEEVSNLNQVVLTRMRLKKIGVIRLDVISSGFIFTFSDEPKLDPQRLIDLVNQRPNIYRFVSQKKLRILTGYANPREALARVRKIVSELLPSSR